MKYPLSFIIIPVLCASMTVAQDDLCPTIMVYYRGPVLWCVTLTDEAGHVSAPFEAAFNCVEG